MPDQLPTPAWFTALLQRYQALNQRQYGAALMPRVGIFWVDLATLSVPGDPVPLDQADAYGDLRIGPRGHYETWPTILPQYPHWRGQHYEDIPRGRVVWDGNLDRPRFLIYTAPQLRRLPAARTAICRTFPLPKGHWTFDFTDPHYQLPAH